MVSTNQRSALFGVNQSEMSIHLIILGVEESGSSDPCIGIAREDTVESSNTMDTHQSQTLLAGESKSSVVVVHSHLTISILIGVLLNLAGSELLKLCGITSGFTVNSSSPNKDLFKCRKV